MMMTASPFYGHNMMNNKLPKFMYGIDYPAAVAPVHDTVIVKQESPAIRATVDPGNSLSLTAAEMENTFISSAPPLSTSCSTPTSTRFLGINQPVTNEQESYAQGFFDALRQIRTRTEGPQQPLESSTALSLNQPMAPASNMLSSYGPNPSLGNVANTYVTATTSVIPTHLERTLYHHQTPDSGTSSPYSSHEDLRVGPSPYGHLGGSPVSMTCSPATSESDIYEKLNPGGPHDMFRDAMAVVPDMRTQEQLKSERKKARNRIAASKCRQKRLAREATLQDKVSTLRIQHKELQSEKLSLNNSIAELRKQVNQHLQKGCHMDLPHIVNSNKKKQAMS